MSHLCSVPPFLYTCNEDKKCLCCKFCPTKRQHIQELSAAEMCMLRWIRFIQGWLDSEHDRLGWHQFN